MTRQRATFVRSASRFGAAMSLALALLQLALGSESDALVGLVCSGICLITMFNLERVGDLAIHAVIGALTTTFAVAILLGSIAYISWLGTVSVLAIMLLGRRAGLAWTVVIFFVLVVSVWIISLPGATAFISPGTPLVRFVRAVSSVPTLAVIAFMFEAQRRDDVLALQRALDARGRLLANVSHEMRTPLNGIIGMLEALRTESLPPSVVERLDIIHSSGQTLLSLINELLDVTRAEATTHLVLAPTELRALVTRTIELHRARASAAGKTLTLELPAAPVHISTDPVRLQQVVGNLVANSVKHGGTHIAVRFDATTTAGHTRLQIAVEDDGPGISAEQQSHLFQPFAQLNPLTALGGSGLGLFISQSVSKLLGGELVLAPGPGCRFVFSLSAPAIDFVAPAPPRLHAARATVVDDNAINRKVATAVLEKCGLTVTTFDGGEGAVAVLLDEPVDVVFMDLQMPGMDGLEVTRQLRSRGYTGPIVALTASHEPDIEAQCSAAGMNGFLLKPLQLSALEPVLAKLMRWAAGRGRGEGVRTRL